jgi:hypothetical protein
MIFDVTLSVDAHSLRPVIAVFKVQANPPEKAPITLGVSEPRDTSAVSAATLMIPTMIVTTAVRIFSS